MAGAGAEVVVLSGVIVVVEGEAEGLSLALGVLGLVTLLWWLKEREPWVPLAMGPPEVRERRVGGIFCFWCRFVEIGIWF